MKPFVSAAAVLPVTLAGQSRSGPERPRLMKNLRQHSEGAVGFPTNWLSRSMQTL
jgi:hypothetical protein